jgi:ubiquitin-conjugating enzyme E2 Z
MTLSSVCISMQSLLNEKPYRNEPGYEKAKGTEKQLKNYLEYIRHEKIRVAVCDVVEDILFWGVALSEKSHQIIQIFKDNYEAYLKEVDDMMIKDKEKSPKYFGTPSNGIKTFDFSGLKQRLEKLKDRVSSTILEPEVDVADSFFLGKRTDVTDATSV